MHSHDRTLLASLGFADPDKGDWRHGMACQYLAKPEIAERFLPRLVSRPPSSISHGKIEVHLTKGEGQYQTTIGFLDVVIPFECAGVFDDGSPCRDKRQAVVEVKIFPTDVGNIIRQLNLYHQYCKLTIYSPFANAIFAVATLFPMTALEVETLQRSGIYHLQLGQPFQAWLEKQEALIASGEANADSIEL